MPDYAIILNWLEFAFRWLHVITGIAWIGSSFYFIALDLGLRKAAHLPAGVTGEEWQVHGGGFYHIEKYSVAPDHMPEHLTWFKWESYATWLSGFALMMVIYWAGGELYLVDRAKADLALWQGILISGGSLAVGWIAYDLLCKSPLGRRPTSLMLILFIILVFMSWGYDQVFTGRAALLHLGAFTATIMSANVFMIIIPNQKIVVADLKAGRVPDAKYGQIAKLRSTHNNYLTLPVLFLMLSNHYPLSFASEYNWVIASLVFLMGVTIRHYFNSIHARAGNPHWTWVATALIFIVIMWLSSAGGPENPAEETSGQSMSDSEIALLADARFSEVKDIIVTRCAGCHSANPLWPDVHLAPKGMNLDTKLEIARAATQIYLQAGITTAMPPANVTFMEASEREEIVAWFRRSAPLAGTFLQAEAATRQD